jgi:nicotinic acid mononucleotide adenylyltransferase
MCQRAVDQTSDWMMVDTWEPMHKEYQPTAIVLDHFDYEINTVRKGIDTGKGTRKRVQVVLLAGADLVHTMSTPGVWSEKDLDHILGQYGVCYVVSILNFAQANWSRLSSSSEAGQILTRRSRHCSHGKRISMLFNNLFKMTLAALRFAYSSGEI